MSKKKIRRIMGHVLSKFVTHDLKALAKLARTDKWGLHRYAQHYATHFQSRRKKKLNILEIGVGGY